MGARRRQHGNVAIWAALAFTTVGAFMALSIHAGRSYSNRAELQNGADAAALAAASRLDGTQAGLDAAVEAATTFGARHSTENQAISVAPADVTFGSWDRKSATFTEITGRTSTDLNDIIAVQVRDARLDLPVAFGPGFLGAPATTAVRASAVAVGGGPCEQPCAFPIAFADCLLLDADGNLKCDDRFYVLSNDWQDNLGLTTLSLETGTSAIRDALAEALAPSCTETSKGTSADTSIWVTNGNPLSAVFKDFDKANYPLEVVAPVVHADRCEAAQYGTDPKFNGAMRVVGFVSIVICYVTPPNFKPERDWPPAQWATEECGAAPNLADFPGVKFSQTIFLKHRCLPLDPIDDDSKKAGCQSFNTWTSRSRLVQ